MTSPKPEEQPHPPKSQEQDSKAVEPVPSKKKNAKLKCRIKSKPKSLPPPSGLFFSASVGDPRDFASCQLPGEHRLGSAALVLDLDQGGVLDEQHKIWFPRERRVSWPNFVHPPYGQAAQVMEHQMRTLALFFPQLHLPHRVRQGSPIPTALLSALLLRVLFSDVRSLLPHVGSDFRQQTTAREMDEAHPVHVSIWSGPRLRIRSCHQYDGRLEDNLPIPGRLPPRALRCHRGGPPEVLEPGHLQGKDIGQSEKSWAGQETQLSKPDPRDRSIVRDPGFNSKSEGIDSKQLLCHLSEKKEQVGTDSLVNAEKKKLDPVHVLSQRAERYKRVDPKAQKSQRIPSV
eukprot:CAMPEP_0170485762 /NCGR_PEP_ID=MMETSP0208-20121228/4935_1 /TAXON_ID=197538 /ORGANISM="Strombidium inclinatum, Strain S3" /LENGTH=343 /DNA_ID=CAMNT_0010759491 /DNA_START=337 /DNA_END=1371 /DNA_ORIENTATION=-